MFKPSFLVTLGLAVWSQTTTTAAFSPTAFASLQSLQLALNTLIADINTAKVRPDYLTITTVDYTSLLRQFTSLQHTLASPRCPAPSTATASVPSTADAAIAVLQGVQLTLNTVEQDLLTSSGSLQRDLCVAIAAFGRVSCFARAGGCAASTTTKAPPTTITTSASLTSSTSSCFADCNPAHSYPSPVVDLLSSGCYQLTITETTSASTATSTA